MTATIRSRCFGLAAITALTMTSAACSGGSDGAATTASRRTPPVTTATGAPTPSSTRTPTAPHTAVRAHDPLTGGKLTTNPVIAVKLENTAAAMPQTGLSPADLVFVEEVEGGLTRLMPIYHSSFPKRVEPVRSARSTDIQILPMFGRPTLVYSGVASQIRKKLRRAPITLHDNGTRDPHRTAPHNLYFNVHRIAQGETRRRPRSIGLSFARSDAATHHAPKRSAFTVRIGNDRFSFSYKGSHYLPSWNGRPYTDPGAGGKRVTADNVLVLHVREVSDGYKDPAGTPVYRSVSTGSGGLTLYRSGKKLSGTWRRAAPAKPFRLKTAAGTPLHLSPGKTWILLRPWGR